MKKPENSTSFPPRATVELHCRAGDQPEGVERVNEPVTCGVPWPKGSLSDSELLALEDAAGQAVPLQVRILDRWSDGSIRWTLLDWLASSVGEGVFRLKSAKGSSDWTESTSLDVDLSSDRSSIVVSTGPAQFGLRKSSQFPFDSVEEAGRSVIDPEATVLTAIDQDGREYVAEIQELEIEEQGPIRVAIRVEGQFVATGASPLLDFRAVLHFYSGSPTVRFELTITNPLAAAHPNGLWELGSGGSVHLHDVSLQISCPGPSSSTDLRFSIDRNTPAHRIAPPLEVYQDSSGGDNWRSPVHINRFGEIPVSLCGYRLKSPEGESTGRRACPLVSLQRDDKELSFCMRYFWQNFPKALQATEDSIRLGLFPNQFSALHELQGGEQKTHEFHIAFGRDRVSEVPLDWVRNPFIAGASPKWYSRVEAVPFLLPRSQDLNKTYHALIDEGLEGDNCFERKREIIDEYGWRNFGDVYADHEAVFHQGSERLVSHYNNQYDLILGFGIQYLGTADLRWLQFMDQLALHVADIDHYHTESDKSAYNNGLFWHTVHYVDAGKSTHRSYPAAEGVYGGGPSTGNLYTAGLLLHFYLTGSSVSRQTVESLGKYVIDADDGRKTIFRHLDSGFTGHISESGFDRYHGPGRSPANALNALLDAARLTRNSAFLDKAEQLIRRCIHPSDDLEARNLLNAENRWFYTMFLQSLGKYLYFKAERLELDRMYTYARASLLHYARWAVEHEFPYLSQPEILEFPTETWAAQDMRKCEVFNLAALTTSGEERVVFLERARYFFDYSTQTLAEMETRTLARPLALLLTNGFSQAYFDRRDEIPAPPDSAAEDFGSPTQFVTQKERVKKKIAVLFVIGVLGLSTLILLAVLS